MPYWWANIYTWYFPPSFGDVLQTPILEFNFNTVRRVASNKSSLPQTIYIKLQSKVQFNIWNHSHKNNNCNSKKSMKIFVLPVLRFVSLYKYHIESKVWVTLIVKKFSDVLYVSTTELKLNWTEKMFQGLGVIEICGSVYCKFSKCLLFIHFILFIFMQTPCDWALTVWFLV